MQVIRTPRSRWVSTLIKVLVPMLKSYVTGSCFLVTEHKKHFSVLKTSFHSLLHWTRLSISLCNDSHSLTDLIVRKHFFLKECCFRVRVRVRVDTLRKYIPVSFIVFFVVFVVVFFFFVPFFTWFVSLKEVKSLSFWYTFISRMAAVPSSLLA